MGPKSLLRFCTLLIAFIPLLASAGWEQMSDLPALGRHRGIGFSIGNKGYIGLGHYNAGSAGDVIFQDLWEFDPATNAWAQKADYMGGLSYAGTAFVINDIAYVGSGTGPFTFPFYSFDPITNTWASIALPLNGGLDCMTFVIDDKAYFVTYTSTQMYDPVTDTWQYRASPPITNMNWFSTFAVSNRGFLLYPNGNGMYEYDPISDNWISKGAFPGPPGGRILSFEIDGYAYIACGLGVDWKQKMWKYDPELDLWEEALEMDGSFRRFSAGFALHGKGYIGIGTNGVNLNDFWRFDPSTVGLEHVKLEQLSVYPNPCVESFAIECEPSLINNATVEVINLKGKIMLSQEFDGNPIDVSALKPQMYIVRIQSGSRSVAKKFYKQ